MAFGNTTRDGNEFNLAADPSAGPEMNGFDWIAKLATTP
jgi:hypothetical protein